MTKKASPIAGQQRLHKFIYWSYAHIYYNHLILTYCLPSSSHSHHIVSLAYALSPTVSLQYHYAYFSSRVYLVSHYFMTHWFIQSFIDSIIITCCCFDGHIIYQKIHSFYLHWLPMVSINWPYIISKYYIKWSEHQSLWFYYPHVRGPHPFIISFDDIG